MCIHQVSFKFFKIWFLHPCKENKLTLIHGYYANLNKNFVLFFFFQTADIVKNLYLVSVKYPLDCAC